MNKLQKYCAWGMLFLFVSSANFCIHRYSGSKPFNYRKITGKEIVYNTSFAPGEHFPVASINAEAVKITWEALLDVTFRKRFNKDYQMDIYYPVFGANVKKLAGKDLYITGYMIPLDIKTGLYAISRYNYASCFFCGGSGPESVISLKFKTKPRRYETDEYLTMKGKMELNDTNINDFIYIFRDAAEFNEP